MLLDLGKLHARWHVATFYSVITEELFASLFQFPYITPAPHEPVKTLRSLVNIRKDSLRLVRYCHYLNLAFYSTQWSVSQSQTVLVRFRRMADIQILVARYIQRFLCSLLSFQVVYVLLIQTICVSKQDQLCVCFCRTDWSGKQSHEIISTSGRY